ncbi:putative candidate secreted effector protein [Blumeria hordei DH14]|uniref:Putative candidate secreted effector protein n=1 Tax=Blumeria graminis f. sp. hordei (strain DH14) TaxID=546991 RepID=N1JHF1_BLUG1|nr:putative candidate secreted effector protein [Blumeria hordei DH14]
MKIFSLISLAAILSHLTPAIANQNYKCHDQIIGPIPLMESVNNAFKYYNEEAKPGPADKLFIPSAFDLKIKYKDGTFDVKIEVGANSQKQIIYVKAYCQGKTFDCTPTNEPPTYNKLQPKAENTKM